MKLTQIAKVVAVIGILLNLHNSIHGTMVEYIEDAYLQQAPLELVVLTDKAAKLMEFTGDYEVTIPKKAGLQINPANKFVSHGVNPLTKNPVIIINPQWFSNLPENQQLFLLSRYFLRAAHGSAPLSTKLVPLFFLFNTMLLVFLLFWALGKTKLVAYKKWVRSAIAFAIVATCNLTVINGLATRLQTYLITQHDIKLVTLAAQKMHDKDAAIQALEYFDTSIKSELAAGQTYWKQFEHTFANLANELKKKNI